MTGSRATQTRAIRAVWQWYFNYIFIKKILSKYTCRKWTNTRTIHKQVTVVTALTVCHSCHSINSLPQHSFLSSFAKVTHIISARVSETTSCELTLSSLPLIHKTTPERLNARAMLSTFFLPNCWAIVAENNTYAWSFILQNTLPIFLFRNLHIWYRIIKNSTFYKWFTVQFGIITIS